MTITITPAHSFAQHRIQHGDPVQLRAVPANIQAETVIILATIGRIVPGDRGKRLHRLDDGNGWQCENDAQRNERLRPAARDPVYGLTVASRAYCCTACHTINQVLTNHTDVIASECLTCRTSPSYGQRAYEWRTRTHIYAGPPIDPIEYNPHVSQWSLPL